MPKFENFYAVTSPRVVEYYSPSGLDFPFETSFACGPVKTFIPKSEELNIAKANLDSLKPFVDSSIDLEKNYDLLGVAFNAFVVNMANKNGQVISTEVAVSCVENFKFKPINIEHKRSNVVGLITGYGFSEYGTDKALDESEISTYKKPFNVVLSGFVWRVVNEDFVENLENSADPNSKSYLSISASWEMGFRHFNIAKGAKNLDQAVLISNDEDIKNLKNKLIHFGGNGLDEDGSPIFINLIGEVLPLGIGFTQNPAADVSGVAVSNSNSEEEEEEEEEEEDCGDDCDKKKSNENDSKNKMQNGMSSALTEEKIETNSSQIENINVILNKDSCSHKAAASLSTNKEKNIKEIKHMVIKSIRDLSDESLKQICASDIRELLEQEIKNASEKFEQEQVKKDKVFAEAEQQKAELEAKMAELVSNFESLQTEATNLRAEVDNFKSQAEEREKQETFQARMSSIDEDFKLNDEERQIIGEQIKDMDEESFNKWLKAFNVFAKSKAVDAQKEEATEKAALVEASSIVEASVVKEEAIEILEKAQAEEIGLPNSASQQESIRNKFAKAFNNQTIKIDLNK
jgi:hypothetical protein